MAKKVTLSLDEKLLEELDWWALRNGNLKRSATVAFILTQYLGAEEKIDVLRKAIDIHEKENKNRKK